MENTLRGVGFSGPGSIDYRKDLNPSQLEVVMAGDGPLLVIAGAGSGKTRTLTYRVARLVDAGVPPQRILLLTFTNKAAREMLTRVERLLGGEVRRITGGTFHHVGNLVLRRHAELVRRRPDFTILDRDDARGLLAEILDKKGDRRFPKAEVILDIHSAAANTDRKPEELVEERLPLFADVADEVVRAIKKYGARKEDLNLVDFDDLLTLWREVLRRKEVLESLQAAWTHLLVDEYQDTNILQAEIVESIAGERGNLAVVGDDAQSIYSFRGANFGNIIDFPKRFPAAKIFRLETNYRSTPEILALANSSIRRNERQFPKTLGAVRGAGPKPERVACEDVRSQALFVADRIVEMVGEGMALREIAVLYRAHWHSMELQMELTRRRIPFQVRSGLRFFEQAHVRDVAAHLRIVANPQDELAWKRAARLHPGVGEKAAQRIWEALAATKDPLASSGSESVAKSVPKAARAAWNGVVKLLKSLATREMRSSPAEMIRAVLESGYQDYLQAAFTNYAARIEDLRRLADYAERFGEVQEFLAELALAGTAAPADAMEEAARDELVLTTVHQAKGLEWRAVFVIWLAEGKIPDGRALDEPEGLEEERRLFYVACTRAKDRLLLLYPVVADERRMMSVFQRPSRFLLELDRATYEEKIGSPDSNQW